MKTVIFTNLITGEIFCIFNLKQPFTHADYKNILLTLFDKAGESIDNRALTATIGNTTILCETFIEAGSINAYIFINETHVRTMNIAC